MSEVKKPFKTLDFKCALVTGGAGGLGRAFAEHFLSLYKNVIIAGRTESKLQAAVKEMKENKELHGEISYYILDTGDLASLPTFISKITSEHPDLDCLVNNAGVQRPLDVNNMKPEDFLSKADQEIAINVNGPIHLAVGLLPHFRQKEGAVIMNVSSVLGYVPFSIINPVYNGTKSMVHFWTMNLRTQLSKTTAEGGNRIKVVEIVPPTVETELHRERENPDDNKKEANAAALSIGEFMRDVKHGWEQDRDVVAAGMGMGLSDSWYETFGADYEKAASG
ncbi:related to oxidoreductase [Ramularia collo-cygni]|uniref:Related to oxidoreductase n=1 Tax=Ramularia collo-cygni TaxID=112498 RepID=A0A2D3UWA0_9PEZI|nr:related to oxidoreductase [Ramularia collo-cygni]CZT18515.1 related to oxidoreductase [Ramularia collo-cygni]